MKKHYLIFIIIMATLAVALTLWHFWKPTLTQEVAITDRTPIGGDFTLIGIHGPVSLHDFANKVVLLYFGYTSCPDICPTNLGNLSEAMHLLTPAEQQQVQVIMITVDPERDTQAKLDTYVPYFYHSFIGLTGNNEQISQIAKRYGAVYQKAAMSEGALGYAVDHSAYTYLINRQGKLVMQLPHATTGSEFAIRIRQQLAL